MIEIHWTCGDLEEAKVVSKKLVEDKLVACAQIIPEIQSVYEWEDAIQTDHESLVVFKTRKELYDTVREAIEELSFYDVPQIIAINVDAVNDSYLEWLKSVTIG